MKKDNQPAPEYPEVLPCSVLLEPGLRFGKGIKTSTMLAALARRAVYESDMAALSSEERVEFQARIEDFKALIAQPVPVVPDEVTAEDCPAFVKYDVTEVDEAWVRGFNACRAAMLQAEPVCTCPSGNGSLRWPCPVHPGNSPVIPDGSAVAAITGIPMIPSGYVMVPKEPTSEMVKKMRYHVGSYDRNIKDGYKAMLAAAPQSPGSEPATVPGKWIPVSERMPEVGVKVLCFPVEDEPIHAVFNGQLWLQDISWSNSDEPIDNVITCNVTHWMPLPAAPREGK